MWVCKTYTYTVYSKADTCFFFFGLVIVSEIPCLQREERRLQEGYSEFLHCFSALWCPFLSTWVFTESSSYPYHFRVNRNWERDSWQCSRSFLKTYSPFSLFHNCYSIGTIKQASLLLHIPAYRHANTQFLWKAAWHTVKGSLHRLILNERPEYQPSWTVTKWNRGGPSMFVKI